MGELGGPPLRVQSSWWAWAQRDAMVECLQGRDHSPNISRLASPPRPQGLEGARPAPLRPRPLVRAVCPPERQQQCAHGRCGVALRHQGQPPEWKVWQVLPRATPSALPCHPGICSCGRPSLTPRSPHPQRGCPCKLSRCHFPDTRASETVWGGPGPSSGLSGHGAGALWASHIPRPLSARFLDLQVASGQGYEPPWPKNLSITQDVSQGAPRNRKS